MIIDPRTRQHIDGLHADLVRLIEEISPPSQIKVIDGIRTLEEQKQFVSSGASKTMNSRHLTGHAFDFGVWIDGAYSTDADDYLPAGKHIKEVAKREGIPIEWGGDWGWDYGHVQLDWAAYPIAKDPPRPLEKSTTVAAAGGIGAVAIVQQMLETLGAFNSQWVGYAMVAVILVFAGWVIKERIIKAKRDGS